MMQNQLKRRTNIMKNSKKFLKRFLRLMMIVEKNSKKRRRKLKTHGQREKKNSMEYQKT